jgi:lysophospholipase L1-like esterase
MLRAHRRRRFAAASAASTLVAGLCVALASSSGAATGDGTPTDSNISFVGRWDIASSAGYVPNWAGAYLTTGFTGTRVKLKQRKTIDLYYSIDGGAFTLLSNVSGTVNLTPTALTSGNHTLRVSYRIVAGSYHGDAVFQGLALDSGAKTYAVPVPSELVEFVGDSITVGQTSSQVALSSYGWLTGERLGLRHTQIAQGGACLRELTAAQSTRGIACVGLQKRFTKIGARDGAADWSFSRYTANVVVINLGTNDTSHGVTAADFQAGYLNLLTTVRARYPNAAILALRTFAGRYATQTKAAVAARTAAGDRNVFYVDTTGWIDSTLRNDSVHPNDAGHRAIAAKLAPIVSAHLGGSTSSSIKALTAATSS